MRSGINLTNGNWQHALWSVFLFALLNCSHDEQAEQAERETIAIPVEIKSYVFNGTRSIDTLSPTVNRVLFMPFKKVDESIPTNDDSNFSADFSSSIQVEFDSGPSFHSMLELEQGATYKLFAVGYNNNDYDVSNPWLARKFELEFTGSSSAFNSFYYNAATAVVIPDVFSAEGVSYDGDNPLGPYFKPEDINIVKLDLKRFVSGLNVQITDIPEFVSSITLVTEKLVKSANFSDYSAVSVHSESAPDNLKTFSTQTPEGGVVNFSHYLLPTLEINKTRLFLDVSMGSFTERYPISVNQIPNISTGDSIRFYPNQAVKITGSYAFINIGFLLDSTINLEDDEWDGLEM